ncbi:MAG: thiamine pyrophosphate-binding protein [Candidatus Omnitrophota bacterium]
MKLSDYIVDFLARQGSRCVFLVSGGAIIHCVDSASRHPGMTLICSAHEQGAGASADGYSRISGNLGAVMATSGPGATNLTTSICNAYFDSVPFVMICGQVATFRIKKSKKLRQKGFQETELRSLFASITNYIGEVRDPRQIKYELQKAFYLARKGRPGPVLLDVPDDIQRADIHPDELPGFVPEKEAPRGDFKKEIKNLFELIKHSKRPVFILGAGVGVASSREKAVKFAEHFNIPVLLTWGGKDIMPFDHYLNMGGLGVCGPRAGNFAAQTADLVIAMGTRLSQLITGGKQDLFAPKAKKVMIDIDPEEFAKFTKNDFKLDFGIQADLSEFLNECEKAYGLKGEDRFKEWRSKIEQWKREYPVIQAENINRKERVDGLVFLDALSEISKEGDVIVADTGANLAWTMQTFKVKKGQRIISAWNHTPMGYALPASIGAALACGREVICVTGDGGILMSLEELATIRRNNIPVKIFIMLNRGHGIQKQTMDTWLNSRYTAADENSGLYFPDFVKIGEAFDLPTCVVENNQQIRTRLKEVFALSGPVLCVVEVFENQKIVPMLKFGAGLEDLDPKLPRAEIDSIMKIADE